MWDTVDSNRASGPHLSHDMPCPWCGHAKHVYLPCDLACGCTPQTAPGLRAGEEARARPESRSA